MSIEATALDTPLQRRITEKYPVIACDLLGPLLDLLRVSRELCGDVDKFLVLLVVGIRTFQHPELKNITQEELLGGSLRVFPGLGTNVRSIAASVGIPKETVRRKVSELVETGWLARRGHSLYLTGQAYEELAPVRESIEALAVRYYRTVSSVAAEA